MKYSLLKENYSLLMLLLFSLLMHSTIAAAKNFEIIINMDNEKLNQSTQNNQVLGTGYVKSDDESYVIVSSNAEKVPGQQATFIFRGKNNPKNRIAIKLGGEGWHSDKSGLGISSYVNLQSKFKLYFVNDYRANPDVYFIHLFAKKVKVN
ncbi:hypothetical protein KEP72_21865 [Escherichia coli]|nr:hypothetical protein [Escherichia coli]